LSGNGSSLMVIERILRDRHGIWEQIVKERELTPLTVSMLASSAVALAFYGAVLGSFHGPLMALTSSVKLPLLFLITLAICLPTLYLFNLVFGARLSVRQSLALVMVAITVTSMLAMAFAPISLFFRITTDDYSFFKLLNVAILTLSAVVGLRFLTGGMEVLNQHGLLSTAPRTEPAGEAPAAAAVAARAEEPVPVPVGAPNGDSAEAAVPAAAPAQTLPAVTYPVLAPAPQHRYAPPPVRRGLPQAERPASMTLLYIWILLFGFVGTQLAWTLRPFFGDRGQDFALFRGIEGNFYSEIIRTIANLG